MVMCFLPMAMMMVSVVSATPEETQTVAAAVPGKADATEMTAVFEAELIFPLHDQHNHAPAIVECPNGDLLVSWYRGSGECEADDVAIYGARRRGATRWSE